MQTDALSAALLALALMPLGSAVTAQDSAQAPLLSRAQFEAAKEATPPEALPAFGAINCAVRPSREVQLSPSIDGIVAEVFVQPGAKIAKGDSLLRLDTRLEEAELALLEARAAATAARDAADQRATDLGRRVARLEQAYAREAVSLNDLESAVLDLRRAEADVARSREDLALIREEAGPLRQRIALARIASPVSGVVGEDLLSPGESTAGRPLATVYVLEPLRVEAFVPADFLGQLAAGAALSLTINDQPVAPEAVQFDYVSPIAEYASGTVSVFLNLTSDTIIPGSRCRAMLTTS